MTLLFENADWTPEILERIYEECCRIGEEELKLTWYPNQFEIVSYENMLDVYSSVGMPMMYNHWSFGKSFINNSELYKAGKMGLALEMVLNTNPCVNYLMDENTATAQALVIAHAAIGHNSFFKNNYLFKQWTSADSIIDYLGFAKKYIAQCEEQYGIDEVEKILDAAHSLMDHSVDMYTKPKILSAREEREKQKMRDAAHEANYDELWSLIPNTKRAAELPTNRFLPNGPEENLLYFLEKNSPILKSWQREILRIVRKIASYYRPQAMSKTINEGWASTCHYYIMTRLHEKGLIDDGSFLEFIKLHTSVVFQPEYDSKYFSGFNPYHLGFSIFADMKRMSQNPTEEDRLWFPDYAGGNWVENWHYMYQEFRDDGLIQQFLSPKVMRDMKLFSFDNRENSRFYKIADIGNESGYKNIRNSLAYETSIGYRSADIQITDVDFNTRTCILTNFTSNNIMLDESTANKTLDYFRELWGFKVVLVTVDRQSNFELDRLETD